MREARTQLEFGWRQWEDQHRERLGNDSELRPDVLSPKRAAVLAVLPTEGLPAIEWELAAGLPVGTFCYCRDHLVELRRVWRGGDGRGAQFRPASHPQARLVRRVAGEGSASWREERYLSRGILM